jgi:hypothetical protein
MIFFMVVFLSSNYWIARREKNTPSFVSRSMLGVSARVFAASFFYQRRFTESRIVIYRKAQFFYRCFRGGAMGF